MLLIRDLFLAARVAWALHGARLAARCLLSAAVVLGLAVLLAAVLSLAWWGGWLWLNLA